MNAVSSNQVANANSNNVVVIDSLHGALHQGQLMNHHHHGMTMPLHQQFQVQGDPQQLDLNSYHANNAQQQQGAIDSQGNVMTPFDIQVCFLLDLYYIFTFLRRYLIYICIITVILIYKIYADMCYQLKPYYVINFNIRVNLPMVKHKINNI